MGSKIIINKKLLYHTFLRHGLPYIPKVINMNPTVSSIMKISNRKSKNGFIRNLVFQWYLKSKRVSEQCVIKLEYGDCYIMSDKAVGHDWKKRNKLTLRHGAGLFNSNYIQ